MSEAMTELEALREATRVRVNKTTIAQLRDLAECYDATGDRPDRVMAAGLLVLIEMHDKLEAIRRGQA